MKIPNKLLKYPIDTLTQALEIYALEGDIGKSAKKANLSKEGLLELIKANKNAVLTYKEEAFREKLLTSMRILHEKVETLTYDVSEATPQGINALASAMEKIHRIYALLGGQPSEIVEERIYERNMIATYNVHEIADSLKEEIREWLQSDQKNP